MYFFRGTVAESPESPSSSEKNNRLLDTGRHWQLWSRRWSSTEEQLTPNFPSDELSDPFFLILCLMFGQCILIKLFAVNMLSFR